ncbi:hypothetical protein NUACC26_081800 [Scytonema sp. NUACC26]
MAETRILSLTPSGNLLNKGLRVVGSEFIEKNY